MNFDDKKNNKSIFYKNKKLFNMHDLNVNRILVSKKESYGKLCLCFNNKNPIVLSIMYYMVFIYVTIKGMIVLKDFIVYITVLGEL